MPLSNSEYDAIMREYETIRDRQRRERDERVLAAEERLPELAALSDELRSLSLRAARQKLADPSADTSWLSGRTALILAKKRQLLLSHGYPEDELSLRFDCPICRDTGYVSGRPCRCFRQKTARRLSLGPMTEAFDTSAGFTRFSFSWYSATMKDEMSGKTERYLAEEAVRRAKAFAEGVRRRPGQNLFVYGNVGVGKTLLLRCIAETLLMEGVPVCYYDAGGLFALFSDAAFRRNGRTSADAAAISQSPVLLLDDLGTEFTNAFVGSELFRLINERGNAGLPTVISSNLDLTQIGELYGERISSRLFESYTPVRMAGSDIRTQKIFRGLT